MDHLSFARRRSIVTKLKDETNDVFSVNGRSPLFLRQQYTIRITKMTATTDAITGITISTGKVALSSDSSADMVWITARGRVIT